MGPRTINRIGQRFGRLVATKRAARPLSVKSEGAYWLADCDCGTKDYLISARGLVSHTRSCGCLLREQQASRAIKIADLSKSFWENVTVLGDDDCWLWTGNFRQGYGRVGLPGRQSVGAHRFAYYLNLGQCPPPWTGRGKAAIMIMHSCDNPPCCNPNHLTAGDVVQNNDDCLKKGRRVFAIGERHGHSKLTVGQVREIRKQNIQGLNMHQIAKTFGVSDWTIKNILTGKVWSHVT